MSTLYVLLVTIHLLSQELSLMMLSILVRDRHLLRGQQQTARKRLSPLEALTTAPQRASQARPSPNHRARKRSPTRTRLWPSQWNLDSHTGNLILNSQASERKTKDRTRCPRSAEQRPLSKRNNRNRHRRISHYSRRALPNLHRPPANHRLHASTTQGL